MTTHEGVERDERTVAVENASYKWACSFLSFALLIDVVYRGAVRNEAAWDLMALVVVSGIICAVYQARQKTLAGGVALLLVCSAVVVASFIAAMYKFHLLH